MITIYTITYNEELLMQFMIDHYRSRFPNCKIVVYDNSSTDRTVEIAASNGCEIRTYESSNTLNDGTHMKIKNTCWKDSKTDWVLVCDLDEMLDIDSHALTIEENSLSTIIKTEGWTMINMFDNLNFHDIDHGVRHTNYDKSILFNKNYISDINYDAGCHTCNPKGILKYSSVPYILYHYRFISADLYVEKSKLTATRLSDDNKRNHWGHQCTRPESELREHFKQLRAAAIKAPQKHKY